MRVLFADNLSEFAIEHLRARGIACDVMPWLTADDLPEHISDYEVLVVRSTGVNATTLEAGSKLDLVVRAGAGTNTIDCVRAAQLGIVVSNVPARNAMAVAELTLGLMFAVDRNIANATADARSGIWNKKAHGRSRGLYGATLGILGMGSIGLEVAKRAIASGLDVITTATPAHPPATLQFMKELGIRCTSDLCSLLGASDIVSLHVPAWPTTVDMVDSYFLASMKTDAILINTSRGSAVVEADLIAALDSTEMRAGIDVCNDEPNSSSGEFYSELARHPKVTFTHHIGASTHQAQTAIAKGTIEVIEKYCRGMLTNCVNLELSPVRAAVLSITCQDQVRVLALVLQELNNRSIDIGNMNSQVLAGGKTSITHIDVTGITISHDEFTNSILAIPGVLQAKTQKV
ncbi:MAG: hypothetical protein OXI96_00595 [Acidimicrobiaceae bacterium]|nr:hypothetical protein [Acidimicrobiaceae bacterium]